MSEMAQIVHRYRTDMQWSNEQIIDLLVIFLEELEKDDKIKPADLDTFFELEVAFEANEAREESEAGDLEMDGCFATCPICGAVGSPDAIHKGECHAHLAQG